MPIVGRPAVTVTHYERQQKAQQPELTSGTNGYSNPFKPEEQENPVAIAEGSPIRIENNFEWLCCDAKMSDQWLL